ncbi:MAG: hypothetical protein HYV77_00385 [Candidatus Wildermuthbacteria bacterium]|nr:hypothetical protein [Candidatus Wildermuthbacteria bacterium]
MTFPLRVFAIDREIFVGEAESVTLPSASGQIQILPNHAQMVSLLTEGDVLIKSLQGMQKIPIVSGVVEVKSDETIVLVNF